MLLCHCEGQNCVYLKTLKFLNKNKRSYFRQHYMTFKLAGKLQFPINTGLIITISDNWELHNIYFSITNDKVLR